MVANYFAKKISYTNYFALADDSIADYARNFLRSSGIYKISLTLLVILCLIGKFVVFFCCKIEMRSFSIMLRFL